MLSSLIDQLTKEEVRHLKLLLNRTSSNGSRKDVALFDFIRKHGNGYNEEKINQSLYGTSGKNALYRLKNRLNEDIAKSLTLQYYSSDPSNMAMYYLALARHFFERQGYELAFEFLKKAEKQAKKVHSFEVLELIYTDFIKLAHESLAVNPEDYIEKRKKARDRVRRIQEIDDILAVLIYKIKLSQNYAKQNYEILRLLKETIDKHTQDEDHKDSPQLRFKVYHALSRILLQQRDFGSLESYLLQTFNEFTKEGLFDRGNHDTKLQMLTYLANSLFKNGKFDESLKYAEELRLALEEFNGFLKEKYLFYYYNILVINHSALDIEKATEIIKTAMEDPIIDRNPMNRVFLRLNLAQLQFDSGEFRAANKNLVRLKLDDSYTKLDDGFKLKIDLGELIVRYELGDYDYIEYFSRQIRKTYSGLLNDETYERQSLLLDTVNRLIYTDRPKKEKELMENVRLLLKSDGSDESDLINYNHWLESKIKA